MSKETGGPAFPAEYRNQSDEVCIGFAGDEVPANCYTSYAGLSIRDHFAGLAMQALIPRGHTYEATTSVAYLFADAMLQERNKP